MSESSERTENFAPRADPPRVEDPSQIKAVANLRLGNAVYVHAIERLPDGDFMAYLGYSIPYDTSRAAGENELSFINYGPIGAVRAKARDGGEWFELNLPDRDALDEACKMRRKHESQHRSALVPGLTNTLEDRQEMHHEEYSKYEPEGGHDSLSELDLDQQEMYDYAFNRGMAQMASLLNRRVSQHLDDSYAGDRRWSKHDTRSVMER